MICTTWLISDGAFFDFFDFFDRLVLVLLCLLRAMGGGVSDWC